MYTSLWSFAEESQVKLKAWIKIYVYIFFSYRAARNALQKILKIVFQTLPFYEIPSPKTIPSSIIKPNKMSISFAVLQSNG